MFSGKESNTANCPTNTAGYWELRLTLGIGRFILFLMLLGKDETGNIELDTVNAATNSKEVLVLTKPYDYQVIDWCNFQNHLWRSFQYPCRDYMKIRAILY